MTSVILDTGPLVAWFCPRDRYHSWARKLFDTLAARLITCEAVVAETCHLAAKDGVPPDRIIEFLQLSEATIHPLSTETAYLRTLLQSYRNTGMDFADACLVRIAEFHSAAKVCTIDSDFEIYRIHGNQSIPLLAPFRA